MLDDTLVDLGRRVRPHADGPGQTAATITSRASRCGWPAAASRGASAYGATDELGYDAVEDVVHVHDLHATMLHLLRHRPPAADLPLPGPRLPADRRGGQGGQADPGVRVEIRPVRDGTRRLRPAARTPQAAALPSRRVEVERSPWYDGKNRLTTTYRRFIATSARRLSGTEVGAILRRAWDSECGAVEHAIPSGLMNREVSGVTSWRIDQVASHRDLA